ncbi:MAG: Ig-like domain-containing protein, partial [Clostridia bacterium]|nr:Ig-like domain-containing protein [Clostridia bacterium]
DDGTVFCLKEGIALINLTASGGNKTSCKVNVLPPATGIAAVKDKVYLYAGGTETLTATTVGGGGFFYAESLDESVAVVEEGVTVKALKPGVCSIRLSIYSEVNCLVELHVLPFPSECTLRVTSTTIAEGESMTFSVAEEYTAAMPFAFESSAPSVLRVDGNGTVTALSRGNATLIAYSGGFRQEVPIEVVPMARALSFDEKDVMLGVGDSMLLNLSYKDGAGTAIYSSSNEAAVRVDKNGQITALAPGEATVTARLKNNVSASVQITVLPGAEKLYTDQQEINVGQGDHFSLGFRFNEGTYSLINYMIEDGSLISWQGGNDFAAFQSQGRTLVTASTAAGANEQIWVNVINAPSEMRIDAEALFQEGAFTDYLRLPLGGRHELNIDFGGYTSVNYSCVSFDSEIASVDEKGTIEGLAPGTAHIRVQSYNGLARDIMVEVTEA